MIINHEEFTSELTQEEIQLAHDLIKHFGRCGYLYQKTEGKHTLIADPKDKGWYEDLRGKPIFEAQDTGNGIEFNQRNKNRLDYDEAQELFFLLKKML